MTCLPLLIVFATLDPRGSKIGGIETHIRHILRNHPREVELLLVGIDEKGDLGLGRPHDVTFADRQIAFFPVAHVPSEEARVSASRLAKSTTLRFVLGGLRHGLALKRLIAGRAVSADLPRVEFAILPFLLGIPYALTIHSDLAQASQTDSLLKRYGALKRWSEGFAFRAAHHVFAVNGAIHCALVNRYPALARSSDVLPVPVDTRIFAPSPFPVSENFRLVYAGRFDEVKDPALMFETVAALAARLDSKLEFHVVGSADPSPFPEFAAIRKLSVIHGPKDAKGVARIIRDAHCAIMTSHSEGLPCFLLETLASGRAFGAIHLPSFAPFVIEGKTGQLVPRGATRPESAQHLAAGLAAIWDEIRAGALAPETIAKTVSGLSVKAIFSRLFDVHASIRQKGRTEATHSASVTGEAAPTPRS